MTKREFEKLLKDSMSKLPLEKQEEFLNKVKNNWILDVIQNFNENVS